MDSSMIVICSFRCFRLTQREPQEGPDDAAIGVTGGALDVPESGVGWCDHNVSDPGVVVVAAAAAAVVIVIVIDPTRRHLLVREPLAEEARV
jgi:hypothetical protein